MYVYQIYNLRVASEFEIPTAAESCSDEKIRPDVRLYLDPLEEGYASLLKYRETVGDSGTPEMQKQKLIPTSMMLKNLLRISLVRLMLQLLLVLSVLGCLFLKT